MIGGLGFVGVAIGGGLMGASAAASTEAEDMAAGLSSCPSQSPAGACGELADKVDSENTLHNAGLGTVVAGSVLLATGVALIIWSFSADDAPADEQPAASRPATGRFPPQRTQCGEFFRPGRCEPIVQMSREAPKGQENPAQRC